MPITKATPQEFFTVHYKSTVDGSTKFYGAVVMETCLCGAPLDKPHNAGCSQKEPTWFGRKSWMPCGEIVVADSLEKAIKDHATRCTLPTK